MTLILRAIPVLLFAGLLAGCASPNAIVPNKTTTSELLQKLGKPTETRRDKQGGESWDYAYGPQGTETWRYGIDRSKKVTSATQLLTLERLHRVVPGVTTTAEVRELLGEPRDVMPFMSEVAWEWYVNLGPTPSLFVVTFTPNGVATGINVLDDPKADGDEHDSK